MARQGDTRVEIQIRQKKAYQVVYNGKVEVLRTRIGRRQASAIVNKAGHEAHTYERRLKKALGID